MKPLALPDAPPEASTLAAHPFRNNALRAALVSLLLLLLVLLVFGQTIKFGFVDLDDSVYISDNPRVQHGLNRQSAAWAFTTGYGSTWIPLTWLSFMVDSHIHDAHSAGGYHAVNVALHAAAAISLFLALFALTGGLWRSALVAALFAVHPLRAESVAWITERKDVLSGLFFALTLLAYAGYARRPFSVLRYLAVCVPLMLGLLAKSVLVTTPFVLLLLDYWPLARRDSRLRIIGEKIPWLLCCMAACVITFLVQGKALGPNDDFSFPWRVGNALLAYVTYLWKFFWPANLAPLYPRLPPELPAWQVAGAAILLAGVTAAVIAARRKYPYLLVGWCWYLGMLAPLIGLVQFGIAAVADRFTYLPPIGLCMALVWGAAEAFQASPQRRRAGVVVAGLILAACTAAGYRQTAIWQSGETLWTHTLELFPQHGVALCNLGSIREAQGHQKQAAALFAEAVARAPDSANANYNHGRMLLMGGNAAAAIPFLVKAVAGQPDFAEAHNNLGLALFRQRRFKEALGEYRLALENNPELAEGHYNLAAALQRTGKLADAAEHYATAMHIKPDYADAHYQLARLRCEQGDPADAVVHLRQALQLRPADANFLLSTAWLLATNANAAVRNGQEATALAQRAVQQDKHPDPLALDTLAAAYAEDGQFPQAIATAQQALSLLARQPQNPLAAEIKQRLALYQKGTAFHEPPAPATKPSSAASPKP